MLGFMLVAFALVQDTPPAPPVGQRTVSPEQMLQAIAGVGPDAGTEDPEVAAAAAFPLGSRDNPVRVGGPAGERAYLARLRCGDGNIPRIGVVTPDGIGAFGSVVDRYSLDCGAAAPGRADILIDPYHEEHVETRAPAGFSLADAG